MNVIQQAKQYWKLRTEWLGEGGQPSPHAQQRANTCLACPHHDCDSPVEEAGKRVAVRFTLDLKRRNGWHLDNEDRLHLCGLCHCLLELKCFAPLNVARSNTPDWENFPEWCWLKTECQPKKKD